MRIPRSPLGAEAAATSSSPGAPFTTRRRPAFLGPAPSHPSQRTAGERCCLAHAQPERGAEGGGPRGATSGSGSSSHGGGGGGNPPPPPQPLDQAVGPLAAARARAAADPYRAAGQRLQSLLSGCGDGEEELLSSLLREESAESKLVVALGAAGIVSAAACVACWLCGLDPLGGASLSVGTLRAAAVGGAAAAPLAVLKAVLWSDEARAELPFLEEVQDHQMEEFQPLLEDLNTGQCLVILGSEVVPGLLILLPAATGGIAKTLEASCSLAGIAVPPFLPPTLALSVAALLAALAKASEHGIGAEEFVTVRDALHNAGRYYQVMGRGRDLGKADSAAAEAAFRAVAVTWMARKQVAARFASIAAALEVLFLGLLWQGTGDLAAPMVAALASAAVDFSFIRRGMPQREHGSQGPSAS